jgi:hypothetical protein
MRDSLVIPFPRNNTLKAIARKWHLITSVLMLAASLGIARGKYLGVDGRLDAMEQSHPDATNALTRRNADELAALRQHVDQIASDVGATRVDVAYIRARIESQAIRATDSGKGLQPDRE